MDYQNATGETLKTPARATADTRKLRFVRLFVITSLVLMVIIVTMLLVTAVLGRI